MKDILDRIADSSPNESSHELFCRLRDCAHEIETLRAALTSRPDAQADERYDLLQAAVNCPHEIESNRVVLHYSDKQPGHNALAQLRERLARAAAPQSVKAEMPSQDDIDLCERIIHAVEGECDGLAITEEQASNILAYLQYGAPICDMPEAFHIVDKAIGAAEDNEPNGGNLRIVTLRIDKAREVRAALAAAPSPDREQVGGAEQAMANLVTYGISIQHIAPNDFFASPSRECGKRQEPYYRYVGGVRFKYWLNAAGELQCEEAAGASTLGQAVEQTVDRERWKRALSFAKGIISRLDTTEVMRSSVNGIAYDAAERAVFIRNLATEALAAPVVVQPQAAEPKGMTDEPTQLARLRKLDTEREAFERWASDYTKFPERYDEIPAWLAWKARALLSKGA